MEINQFVQDALTQVIEGIRTAQSQVKYSKSEDKAAINPRASGYILGNIEKIEFDIAVTVTSQSNIDGGGKLSVMGFTVGGGKSNQATTEAVSRLRFSVPVAMPVTSIDYPKFESKRIPEGFC